MSTSAGDGNDPLFLWLSDDADASSSKSSDSTSVLLCTPTTVSSLSNSVQTPDDVLELVRQQYDTEQFVGGMGESDPVRAAIRIERKRRKKNLLP